MRTFFEEYGGDVIEVIGAAGTILVIISIMAHGMPLNEYLLSFFMTLKP